MDRAQRVELAKELSETFVARYGDGIVATGIRGSVARQEDTEQSNLNFVVVAAEPGMIASRALLYGPIAVELFAIDSKGYLEDARIIGPWWPVRADQFVHRTPLHDPNQFWQELRNAYNDAVAAARDEDFLRAEAANIVQAVTWAYKARGATGNSEAMARLSIAEAALRAVLAAGLRAHFAFKNIAHALRLGPQLPNMPEHFGLGLQKALSSGTETTDAVTAIEGAVEALLELAVEHHVPIIAEGTDEFL
ncbi:MAG: hypothetical protein ACXVQY_11980 [Actinomycetota bacterium]